MSIINRNCMLDAKRCINSILEKLNKKEAIVEFLADKIQRADGIDPENWNLNLDLNGRFLRFNVGQVYCIQIDCSKMLVICLRDRLPEKIKYGDNSLKFLGYDERTTRKITDPNIDDVPDCLSKIPNSIGVLISERFDEWLQLLDNSNLEFLARGIKDTRIKPMMINAHSIGAIDHLSAVANKALSNPSFALQAMRNNEDVISKKLKKFSPEKLKQLSQSTASSETAPRKTTTKTSVYVRNPYVVELAKRNAGGKCQDCRQEAPFRNKTNNEPYLEVHHIRPLSQGGKDNIENTIALCPNCHRKRHYG